MLTIKTYDPGLKFLNDLYFDFTSRSLSRLAESEELEQTKLKGYYHSIEEKRFEIFENQNALRHLDAKILDQRSVYQLILDSMQGLSSDDATANSFSVQLSRVSKALKENQEKKKELNKTVEELHLSIDELQDAIATLVSYRTLPKVHIMYGVGNDLKHWAGPFECYLGETKYSNNGKDELVDYIFATDITSMTLRESDIKSPNEWKTFFSETTVPVMAYKRFSNGLYESKSFAKKSDNVHDHIVKLLSNYLYNLNIKNHLIILPNLDSILSACIDNCINRVIHKNAGALKDAGWEFGYKSWVDSYRPVDSYEGEDREAVLFNRVTNIFNSDSFNLRDELLGIEGRYGRPIQNTKQASLLTAINLQIIQEIFSTIGTGKRTANSPDHDGPIAVLSTGGASATSPVTIKNPFDITAGGSPGKVEGHSLYGINFGNKYSWGEKSTVDYLAPIRDMIDGINSNASNRYIPLEAGYISNQKVVDKVREKFGGGSFVGYVTPSLTPAPPIDDTPYFIVGDRDIINNILYGDYARVSDDPNYTDPNYLSQDLDFVTRVTSPIVGGVLDPFWSNVKEDIKEAATGDTGYIFQIYRLLKNASELNLGYHNGILKTDSTGNKKHLQQLAAQIPDEFGYFRDEEQLAYLYEEKLPIFRAGVTNANVLSYAFDADKFIYGSLTGTIREVYYNVSKAYLRKNNPITFDGTLSPDELREKLVEVGDALRARRLFSGRGLTSSTGTSTPAVPLEMYDDIARIFLADSLGSSRRYRKGKSSSVLAFFMLFMDCFEREYLGTLKTLPMFHISKHSNILQPCLSLIKSTRKVHTSTFSRGDSSVSDFFSGQFRMLGFAHTITRSSAYSEFSVQKDIVGDFNNE